MTKQVTKWRLTDKNIPASERTFDSRERALSYLALAWKVYPDMKRCRLSQFDITTEVISRPEEGGTSDQRSEDMPTPA